MADAVIVSTARTPIGKAYRGAFNNTHGAVLGGHVIRHAVERAGLEPGEVEDVVMGCALPEGATGQNIARQAALRAGLPVTVAGMTVNRFCSSGMQAIAIAAQRVLVDGVPVVVAGGLESISLVQNEHMNLHRLREEWLETHKPEIYMTMIETAEVVAKRYYITREKQDEYALASQHRCAAAQKAGRLDAEIVPMTTKKIVVDKASDRGKAPVVKPRGANKYATTGAFSHQKHAAQDRVGTRGRECLACHSNIKDAPDDTTIPLPTMQGCYKSCHNGANAFDATGATCTRCHKGGRR